MSNVFMIVFYVVLGVGICAAIGFGCYRGYLYNNRVEYVARHSVRYPQLVMARRAFENALVTLAHVQLDETVRLPSRQDWEIYDVRQGMQQWVLNNRRMVKESLKDYDLNRAAFEKFQGVCEKAVTECPMLSENDFAYAAKRDRTDMDYRDFVDLEDAMCKDQADVVFQEPVWILRALYKSNDGLHKFEKKIEANADEMRDFLERCANSVKKKTKYSPRVQKIPAKKAHV